mgnify:FL=1
MVSKAWKELEKHVADKLGGRRLSGANYCESQPDVIVDDISNATLGASVYDKKISLIVECKYRTDQPWQRLVTDKLQYTKDSERVPLVVAEDLIFWDINHTQKVMSLMFGLPQNKCNLLHIIRHISITTVERKIPLFIRRSLAQSECYGDWAWENAVLWIPILCLGQKASHKKIMVSSEKNLWGIKTEYGRRQASHTYTGGAAPSDLE